VVFGKEKMPERQGVQKDGPSWSTRCVCVCAIALAAFWLSTTTALAEKPGETGSQYGISEAGAKEALKEAKALLSDRSTETTRALTPTLRNLALGVSVLTGKKQRTAEAILARPTDANAYKAYKVSEAAPFCTTNFCVHYVTSGINAPDLTDVSPANGIPDYVDSVADAAETSFAIETGTLGWATPPSDGSLGGNSKTDIYLMELSVFGYALADVGKGCTGWPSAIGLRNSFSGVSQPFDEMRTTVAHEYNHVLEFGIDGCQDAWMMESTASYIETQVFPMAPSYFDFVDYWAKDPQLPITTAEGGHEYGSAVFQYFVSRNGSNASRDVFRTSGNRGGGWESTEMFNKVFKKFNGSDFSKQFLKFVASTAEWKSSGIYENGSLYNNVKRSGKLKLGKSKETKLNHTAYQLYDIPVGSKHGAPKKTAKLSVKALNKKDTHSGLALVGRRTDGTVISKVKYLKKGGKGGSLKLQSPVKHLGSFARVTAVVANVDGVVKGWDQDTFEWRYKANKVKYKIKLK
jgi:hypothetical protein